MDEMNRLMLANITGLLGLPAKKTIGSIKISAGFGFGKDIANLFTEQDPNKKTTIGFGIGISIPYDLANIDQPSSVAMSESLTTGLIGILLIVAIVSGPLASALNALGESMKQQQESGSLNVKAAIGDVPWKSHLSGFNLDKGWSALRTPEECRSKLVCELHYSLTNQPKHTLRMIKTLAPLVSVSKDYHGAARSGLKGDDCAALYPQCKMTGLQYLANLPYSEDDI